MEHITFNPVRFWQRSHGLPRSDGIVYITTRNAFKLLSLLGAIRGIVTLFRMGADVRHIVEHVTYGHHWKEYSAKELVRYFATLSPDFDVSVRSMHYAGAPSPFAPAGARGRPEDPVRRAGNASGVFAEQLEAVVTLRARTHWGYEAPKYV